MWMPSNCFWCSFLLTLLPTITLFTKIPYANKYYSLIQWIFGLFFLGCTILTFISSALFKVVLVWRNEDIESCRLAKAWRMYFGLLFMCISGVGQYILFLIWIENELMYYALIPLHVAAVLSYVLGVMRNSFLCTFSPISKINAFIFSLSFLALQGAIIGGRLAYFYHSMYILCIGTLLHSSWQAYRYTLGFKNLYFHQKPIGRSAKLLFGNITLEGNLVSIEPGKYWIFENLEKYVDGKLVFEVDEIFIDVDKLRANQRETV